MLIVEHVVFFIVVVSVSTYFVLSQFPCFLAPLFYVFVLIIILWQKNIKTLEPTLKKFFLNKNNI